MKNMTKRLVSLLLVCVLCFSLVPTALAATVSKVTHASPMYGGGAATVFYVNAKNTSTTKLNYSSTAWCLYDKYRTATSSLGYKRGYFEILVYGKKSNGTWTQISKTNMKNVSSTTLSMKGYTQYKVRVYAWKTSTIGTNIGGKFDSSAYWADGYAPVCTFTAKSNVKSLTK